MLTYFYINNLYYYSVGLYMRAAYSLSTLRAVVEELVIVK